MSSELKITEVKHRFNTEVLLSGEVDIYTSQMLKEKLYSILDETKKDMLINCEGLTYIDSTGLGIFVGVLKKAKQYSRSIRISKLKENIKKLFLITGLDKLFILLD